MDSKDDTMIDTMIVITVCSDTDEEKRLTVNSARPVHAAIAERLDAGRSGAARAQGGNLLEPRNRGGWR